MLNRIGVTIYLLFGWWLIFSVIYGTFPDEPGFGTNDGVAIIFTVGMIVMMIHNWTRKI